MRVGLYVRVSTQEQASEGYSIGEQTERLTKYSESLGWTVAMTYTDGGYSGANLDRPALSKLISDVQDGKLDKVVVYKLDRLSRSQKDTLYLIEDIFLASGTDFVSMCENFDTSSPFGKAMIGILAVFAQLEREQIKERLIMGREARAKEGKYSGSWIIPIGYDYDKATATMTVNEYEKMQVLHVYDLCLAGYSIRSIEKAMLDAGYRHKYGEWHVKTIKNVLRSKTYLGYIKFKKQWYKGNHDPIISQETFDKVQAILNRMSNGIKLSNKVGSYLGGLLVCKRCGGRYNKVNASYGHIYYECASRHKRIRSMVKDPECKNKIWRLKDLDDLIFDQIRGLVTDPDYKPSEKPKDNRPELIRHELDSLDGKISKMMDLYMLGSIPIEMLDARVHDLTDQRQKLEAELESLERDTMTRDDAMQVAEAFGDILDRGNFDEIRAVITSLIDHIELDGDNIDIFWRFS